MRIGKRLVVFVVTLSIVFFIIGSWAELTFAKKTISTSSSLSNSVFLEPNFETGNNITVIKSDSWLNVTSNSTDNIQLYIEFDGTIMYSANESNFRKNFLLEEPGIYVITFLNDNIGSVHCEYVLTLTSYITQIEKPYAWLFTPMFIAGETTIVLILPIIKPISFHKIKARVKSKTNWRKTIIEILVFTFIATLALGFIPLLSLITGTSQPFVSPPGISMTPTIKPGDLVIVVGAQPESLKVGDILVYDKLVENLTAPFEQKISTPILHRIANITTENGERYFITKGDNNPMPDEWYVPKDGVQGKAIYIIPFLGRVFQALGLIQVKILILIVTAVILFLWPSKKEKTGDLKD